MFSYLATSYKSSQTPSDPASISQASRLGTPNIKKIHAKKISEQIGMEIVL